MKPRVYSYIRFSSADQAHGDSRRRQTEAARRYASSNGLELDEGLTLEDLGRSAYAGHHLSEGALGGFLAACEAGLVPPGSILVVEAVDRLTRLDHIEAMSLIGRLVRHVSLHVVQLNRTFTDEIVRHDMGAIFTLIGAITLGHQESQQKAHRIGNAWDQKRKAAVASGKKLTSKAPAWLKNAEHGFEVIPERVAVVRDIFESFARGEAQDSITRRMNRGGVAVWGRGARWNRSYITKILNSEAVLGILRMGRKRKIDKARTIVESVPDYYPAIIETSLFNEAARRIKTGTKGRQPTQNPLQGVLRCPHCSCLINREWKGQGSRAKLVCSAVRHGSGTDECKKIRVDLETFWQEFKMGVAKRAEVAAAAFHPAPINALRLEAQAAREELEQVREAVAKLASPSAFLIGEMTKLEANVESMEKEIRAAGRDVNLAWENLAKALEDETTSHAEISARLRVVFPEGIKLESNKSLTTKKS
jgi:DNA invertase Pin-like site-specific DNA recombinase